ncbi:MAG: DUF4115 domain-containing protein [Candidatus Omnitrophica bacterium]|nr:DUF4115 domain-containing protein [Candidatus Omnitrophota bacterium]
MTDNPTDLFDSVQNQSRTSTQTRVNPAGEKQQTPDAEARGFGAKLRQARLKQGLTLDKIAAETRIHPRILAQLEEDRVEESLGEFYARCFRKAYAQYLNVELKVAEEPDQGKRKKKRVEKPEAQPDKESAEPSPVLPGPAVPGIVAGFWRAWPSWTPWAVGIGFGFLLLLLMRSCGQGTVAPVGMSQVAEPAARTEGSPQQKSQQILPVASSLIDLRVEAKRDVWMRLRSDGQILFEDILPAGTQRSWQSFKPFGLWVGDADALSLTVNGKDFGSPGRGVLRNIRVTREGVSRDPGQ